VDQERFQFLRLGWDVDQYQHAVAFRHRFYSQPVRAQDS